MPSASPMARPARCGSSTGAISAASRGSPSSSPPPQFPEPTASLLFYGATWTLVLVGLAIFFAFTIGSFMGIHAAWHRGGFFDSFFTPINVMLNAFTPAIVALLLFYALSLQLQWFPLGRAHSTSIA